MVSMPTPIARYGVQDDSLEVSLDLNAFFTTLANTGVLQLQLVSQSDREDDSEKELYITGFRGDSSQELGCCIHTLSINCSRAAGTEQELMLGATTLASLPTRREHSRDLGM